MILRIGYDIQFNVAAEVPIVALLKVHPSRQQDLVEPDAVLTEPNFPVEIFTDTFGNTGARVLAPAGRVRFPTSTLIRDSGLVDEQGFDAQEIPVQDLPHEVLPFLMSSRYCEVDLLLNTAGELFGNTPRGWGRVRAI